MKLKNRLVISFLIMMLFPVVMTCAVFAVISSYMDSSMEKSYGVEYNSGFEVAINSVEILSSLSEENYERLYDVSRTYPEQLENESYLDAINNILKDNYSYLIECRNGEVVYNGDGLESTEAAEHIVAEVADSVSSNASAGTYVGGDIQSLIKRLDFTFINGDAGQIYIITDAEGIAPELRTFIVDILISIVVILVFTAIALTLWTYMGIVTPIRRLQFATKNIKEGKLDFSIDPMGTDDELGLLCNDFEQMRKRLEETANENIAHNKRNKELVRNISHDLKTPITSIRGYVEGIMDGVADTPEKRERYLRIIYNKTTEMDVLINELTLYSELDTNDVPYDFQQLPVAGYFGDCAEDIAMDLAENEVTFKYENFCRKDVKIMADPEKLKRAIDNIIGNSLKYIDKKPGFVRLTIKEADQNYIQIEIEDNGIGIAKADLPYIFDRFYRTDASRNSSTGGSGIGLSIVHKIVEDHEGRVWATSEIGQGTCMFIMLKKSPDEEVGEEIEE
ncbi:MAG: HAMP domain-containing histidine kinase [Eubacterium sp.]|nr:HAMP domain-containing histidine kinase [Eubacterium sp.]